MCPDTNDTDDTNGANDANGADDTNGADGANDADRTGPSAEHATVRHDWGPSERPSAAVVEAVAAATGRPLADVPPLTDSLDPDGLDALLTGGSGSVRVTFRYAGTTVSVCGDGGVEVRVDGDGPSDG